MIINYFYFCYVKKFIEKNNYYYLKYVIVGLYQVIDIYNVWSCIL